MKTIAKAFVTSAIVAVSAGSAHAQSVDLRTAERVFFSLAPKERFEIPLLLIATGDYNGMSTGDFGPRLFRGIREFQSSIGAPQTGYLTASELSRLRISGYTAISSWGLTEVTHPLTNAKLNVPMKVAQQRQYTKRGYAFEAYDGTVSVDFSFFSSAESSLEQLYARLGAAGPTRKIDYKVIRPLFFAIAGGVDGRGFYTRYQISRGGIVGYTMSWDLQRVYRGERIANLMANLFIVPLDGSAEPPTNQVALTPPSTPPAAPTPSSPPVAAIPPAATQPKTESPSTGTGFFIGPKRMLTNAHVVDGCDTVAIAIGDKKAGGRVLARDKANDLALIETDISNDATAKLRAGVRLGEDVAAFGFPLTGLLATNGNFTRGGVTATAGLRDNSSQLQISAPVQPGNSGGPLLDEAGNVVGVVASKLKVLQVAVITGDFAQNVNFAIKTSVAQTFLETHGATFDVGAPGDAMKPADLAAKAQSFSGVIECRP